MPTFKTSRCHERAHPEIALTFEVPAHERLVARWVALLEAAVLDGERLSVGGERWLDGWGARIVEDGDTYTLHELDLAAWGANEVRYSPSVDRIAALALEQRTVAERYGLDGELDPPDYLQSVYVCPGWQRVTGRFFLARSRPSSENASGWALRCAEYTHRDATDGLHARSEDWAAVPIGAFLAARPGLVRYLGLPVGTCVEGGFSAPPAVKVGRRRPEDRERMDNTALIALQSRSWSGFDDVAPVAPTPIGNPDPTLDFDRDDEVWRVSLPEYAISIVCERYGLPFEVAEAVVDRHHTPEVLRARARHFHRSDLLEEHALAIEPLLVGPGREPLRAEQNAGRKLRELTGKPFAPLCEIAKRFGADLAAAERLGEAWARRKLR